MRLFRVEVRRLFSRRAVIVMMVLGALAVGAIAAGVLYENRPASAAELARADRQVDQYNQEPWVQRPLARCVEKTGDVERCEARWLLTPDNFYGRGQLQPAQYKPWLISMTGVVAALGLLIGATFVGADYISGSMGTQLLFEPNRRKVWLAKAGAAVVGVGLFSAVVLLLGNGAMWVFAKSWDRPIRPGLLGDYVAAGGRAVLLAAVAGLAGYALVMVARHTAAVLGLLAVYGIAGEAVLRNVWAGSEKWLFSNHAFAWIGGDFKRRIYPSDCYDGCRPEIVHFTQQFAATYVGVGLLAVALASLLVFFRRDVA